MLTTKTSRCKVCRAPFTKRQSFESWCSTDCAAELGLRKLAKIKRAAELREKRQDRVKRESQKTRSDYVKEAQTAFNQYVRTRDEKKVCICCGKPLVQGGVGGGFDCGHYRSVGSAPHLRYDENNAHGQTKQCNRWGAGRAVDYRIGLIDRIGLEAVEALEADQTPRKYSVDELKAIKAKYQAKTKELKANQ